MSAGPDTDETDRLLARLRAEDPAAWADLLARHRDRLRRAVAFRLDRRLRGRVDPSDVIQEACLESH
jgi:RNA polymerase sigma-70 factor, ECF subfamily